MTTHLDSSIVVLGHPVRKLKSLLASWERTSKSPYELGLLSDVNIGSGGALALLGEAWRLGLIDFTQDMIFSPSDRRIGITDQGLALLAATGRGRTLKSTAAKVLQQVLDRAAALSMDPKTPVNVDRIWVFGSFIDPDKSDVGDLDIVVETSRTEIVTYREMEGHILLNYPGILPHSFNGDRKSAEEIFKEKMVFGARRHPLLAPNRIDTLIRMHQPCALFYDASRGGVIAPEFHQHHPASSGRCGSIRDRLMMPALGGSDRLELTPPIVADGYFRLRALESFFDEMHFTSGETWDQFVLRSRRGSEAAVGIRRETSLDDERWCCSYTVSRRGEFDLSYFDMNDLASRISNLAQADMLRIATHRDSLVGMQEIELDVEMDDSYSDDDPFREHIRHAILSAVRQMSAGNPPLLPSSMGFGASLLVDGDGGGIPRPCDFTEEEWMEGFLPFSRDDYDDWAERVGVEPIPF